MERLERPSHPYPPDCLSPAKFSSNAETFCAPGGKRDSPGLSCFSAGSSPSVHDPRKGTSTENFFFKGIQSEGATQGDRPRYLQPLLGNGGWEVSRPEDQPASRVSFAGRASVGPVWQVPEKKRSQSPPPPTPPFRSDSFVATKVFPYPEGPKNHCRSMGKLTESNNQNGLQSQHEKTSEARRSLNPLPTKDFLHPNTVADHNHNQLHPKLFSLSSNDVRHYTHHPAHQRQYSDESPFYLQTRTAPQTKTQSVGSYYRSLQDLPTNAFNRKYTRHSTASMAICSVSQESGGPGPRYWHGLTAKHGTPAAELKARQGKSEASRVENEKKHGIQSKEQGFSSFQNKKVQSTNTKYSLPQTQMPYGEIKESNGHSNLGNGLHYEQQEASTPSRSQEDASNRSKTHCNDTIRHIPQSSDRKVCLSRHQDPWVPQEDHRISPLKTPLLHSLAQESRNLSERPPAATSTTSIMSQEAGDSVTSGSGKACRRSDRYATTLRKEIQQKRAQLQKSRSAATLSCEAEEEDTEEWRSTEASAFSAVSFSNTYKDHLKEAQARVLQATSFQRRDLEPLGPEVPVVKNSNSRVRGRKRLHLAKRTHSFSEPDKIDKLGVEGESQSGSLGERRKPFETKPAFSRPVPQSGQGVNVDTDPEETGKEGTSTVEPEEPSTDLLNPELRQQALLEQQRLGTFAEYQATWNKQKKSTEGKTQGRYHSAENILDTGGEEKNICIHERSRSSPSADFYAQGIHSPWIDPQAQESSPTTRLLQEADHNPQLLPPVPRKEAPVAVLPDHRPKPDTAASPSHATLPSGPRSLSPKPASELASNLAPPPPRTSLGPETTSSSQEFLSSAQADPLQPASPPDSQQRHATTSPRMGRMSRGAAVDEKRDPSLSPLSFLSLPSADQARSPSPQFAPLRLTDQPPDAPVRDDSTLRTEDESVPVAVMDVSSPVRKVPVRIVHTESSSDRDARAYLPPNNNNTCSFFQPLVPSLSSTQYPTSSLFTAFTRQEHPEHFSGQELLPKSSVEEEAKRAELARDIMGRDKSLADILDQSGRKTTMDLMEGLFPTEEQILEGALQRRRASAGSRLPTSSPRNTGRREDDELSASAAASLVPSSSYYNTSAPKAELLIKMKDMQEELEEQDSEDELDIDLASKKQELICSLARKLDVLREARQSLQEDVEDNEALGREVEATVQRLCQSNQLDKFRMFVGDLDKVVSLLLSLSGRLARVENALNSLEDEAPPEEKRTLTEKRKLLMRQHEDAKELKENLDRRERLVSAIMEAHLDAESLDDYRHFVKMKSALIIEQRKLEDKIKLGEEQLKCLLDSLPMEQRPPL